MHTPIAKHDVSYFNFPAFVQPHWLENPAIELGETHISYGGLVHAVESRISDLHMKASAGQVVALEIGKSVEYVINLLAALSVGLVVVPIDPALPEARRRKMIDLAAPSLSVRSGGDATLQGRRPEPAFSRATDAPAYIFFTSGSSGTPKAIIGSQQGLLQFIDWEGAEFGVGPGDRISFLTTVGFDVSLRDILLPLLHGATLVIPEEHNVSNPQAVVEWLRENRISHVHAVPSIVRLWARSGNANALSIKTLFLAGEKLTQRFMAEVRNSFPQIGQFVNLYGPTETTLAKFYHRMTGVTSQHERQADDIPVGRPLPGTRFYLIDESDRTWWVEPDVQRICGEVVIVTPYSSFGYLGAPDEMHNRFHAEPNGTVAYRTGDLGRLTADGQLVITGRCDDEVKINGVRIHPLEVEKVMAAAPMVRDVAVIAHTLQEGELRLLAFWTANPDAVEPDDAAPRSYAVSQLPRAVVPTIWKRLDTLPLNKNGKLDRRALPEFVTRERAGDDEPMDDESRWLVQAVADILKIPTPHLANDLFALGGTSIHVAFLIGRIEKELNKTIDFASLFETSRLSAIAELIRSATTNSAISITPIADADAYSLSPQQRRWWNIYLPERNRSWATMVKPIMLEGHFEQGAIRKAVFDFVAVQDSMRMFFSKENGERRQHIHSCNDPSDIPLTWHDLTAEKPESIAGRLTEIRLSVANQEIDPLSWPLFRIHVAVLPSGRTALIFAIHHMVSDGYSVGLFEGAIRTMLEAGETYAPTLPFNYRSYAQWALAEEAQSFGIGSPAYSYWQELFRHRYDKIIFPEHWTGEHHDRGKGYCRRVPDDIRGQVLETARRERLTEFSIYLAAKFLAWHQLLKRDDIVIGTPAAGRDVPGTELVAGNFISLVCMRSRTPAPDDHIEYTREIMQSVARAMTHQGYQFDRLVRSLELPFEQDRFPLTTLFISYLNFEAQRSQALPESELGHSDLGFAVKFDVMTYVREHQNATSLQVQYRNNLFPKAEIEAFVERWLDAVRKITQC